MPVATNDSYTAASGGGIYAGYAPPASVPAWVNALTPGTWGEISGTNISTAGVRQSQFTGSGAQGVVAGWGAWAKDLTGKRAWLSGGGHSDGADNSVYSINFSADAPAWSRAADGSAEADWVRYHTVDSTQIYANYNEDGKPVAAHLYHWFHYADDKLIRYRYYQDFGDTLGGAMAINPNGEAWTNIADLDTGSWSVGPITPSWTPSDLGGSGNPYGYAAGGVYNGVIYELWQCRQYGPEDGSIRLMSYNPVTATWSVVSGDLGAPPFTTNYGSCLIDTARGQLVQLLEGQAKLYTYPLDGSGGRTTHDLTGAAAGFATSWDSSYYGCCYDDVEDLYYVYSGTSATDKVLRQIDPGNSYATTVVSTSGTPTTAEVCGMNSRMALFKFESERVIVMQPAYNSNLWALRLA